MFYFFHSHILKLLIKDFQLPKEKLLVTVFSEDEDSFKLWKKIAGLKDELTLLQNEFEKDYGTFDINIQDGTINYKDDVKADS